MSMNALRKDYNPKLYKQREELEKQREELFQSMKAYHDDSFIFDHYRLSRGQHDYYDEDTHSQYVNAQKIYDEFVRIDNSLRGEESYSLEIMLEIIQVVLGNRYKAFHNILKKQYRIEPISEEKYLNRAQKNLENILYRYEMDIAIEKWSDRAKGDVVKARRVMINYYRSIGHLELANSIEKAPLTKPKTFTQIAKRWRKHHTPQMAEKCKITKKEATKQLQGVIKNIKSDF